MSTHTEFIERHGRGQIVRQSYCLGFYFSPDERMFVGIMKDHGPPAVVGRINGIGGKIEEGEGPLMAMVREFQEETGVEVPGPAWDHFCTMQGATWEVFCFRATAPDWPSFWKPSTPDEQTEEVVHQNVWLMPPGTDGEGRVVPNLRWLIPFALDDSVHQPNLIACRD